MSLDSGFKMMLEGINEVVLGFRESLAGKDSLESELKHLREEVKDIRETNEVTQGLVIELNSRVVKIEEFIIKLQKS